jgi:hypothetical protein
MGCGGCSRRSAERNASKAANPVMGGYKYLTDPQIKARLEAYKKRHCTQCENRYTCSYENYVKCKNIT